ncbi:MAG: agmatinase [Planctomycetota bacterium]|jgi:agmatinase
MSFDPDAAAAPGSGIFGLPHSAQEAQVHILPVPFDATTSFRRGAALGPEAVFLASHQVDLFDARMEKLGARSAFEAGIWMAPIDDAVVAWNQDAAKLAQAIIAAGGSSEDDPKLGADLWRVNSIGAELNEWVYGRTLEAIDAGKIAVLLGGDHATPFGAMRAHGERYPGMGVLHFDAHADLRVAFEGFTWSHASILHNVLAQVPGVASLVQVGVRDLGAAENEVIRASEGRISTLFGHQWTQAKHSGNDLRAFVHETLAPLPQEVYVTFDIDAFEPHLCPNTGTPVPGGLEWGDAMLFLESLIRSGRRIIGFDMNEVAPGRERPIGEGLDEMVGARLLYRLAGFALASH